MSYEHNPLSPPFEAPHEALPLDSITVTHLREAILTGMEEENRHIDAIIDNADAPTFDNTIAAMDTASELLDRATAVMYNLVSAETNDELDLLAEEMAPRLAAHSAAIMLNPRLFARVKAVRDTARVEGEEAMLLDRTYEGFERSGATLDEEGKERFKAITAELSSLTLRFSQNLLKETNAFTLHITHYDDLAGLPEMQIEQAAAAARERDLQGWVITLQAPSFVPFMTYARHRELRHRLYMAYHTRCTHGGEHDNFAIVARIVNLRRDLARLLGYTTYADYVLKRRMAGNADTVYALLNNLIAHYREPARKEVEAVRALARETEGEDFRLEPWDFAYYSHRLKKQRFDLDAEMLRPYFELSRVKRGVFSLATRLYGITFTERTDIPVYHPDVTVYEVCDADGRYLALLYTDFHPRTGKQGGAWMTTFKEEWDKTSRPHVSIVMNLTKPTDTKPALLTLGEVETFLHEFGHALHGIFADTRFRSLSGTNVYWDFVELPSQFMENFAIRPEFLSTFARHYETDEPIPSSLIDRIIESRNFNVAYACMRQVSFGLLDMAYYTLEHPFATDIPAFEREAWREARLLDEPEGTCMSVQFGHIMSGGYSAGYYSYKWAEVLDADAFAVFRREGLFNRDTAARFRRTILSRGGTLPPGRLYEDFRGGQPDLNALLERDGIIPQSPHVNE